jgi:hypothetical protein
LCAPVTISKGKKAPAQKFKGRLVEPDYPTPEPWLR